MSDDAKITILHLSDLQFGRHHRFGRFGLTDPDVQADKLVARLTRDLEDLRNTYGRPTTCTPIWSSLPAIWPSGHGQRSSTTYTIFSTTWQPF